MTKEEQLERLTKLVQAGKYWRAYPYGGWSEEDSYEYLSLGNVSSCFFTEKEAMQAVYDSLDTTTDVVSNIAEIQIYNKTCHKFGLPPIVVEKSDIIAKIAQTKADLLSKETEIQKVMFEVEILKTSLKKLEELT